MIFVWFLCLFIVYNAKETLCYKNSEQFHEELFIKPLPSNHLYTYFQFTTVWDTPLNKDTFDHSELFARPVGELISRFDVAELHVSLTKGLWRHELWGYPFVEAPPGAELYAWLNTKNVDKQWKGLCDSLSGLLCASLNFIDIDNSIMPQLSLPRSGVNSFNSPLNYTHLRYSSLPREIVCTENLTPWIKLLPCNSKIGLAALLNSDHIYNTVYHSIGLHFRPISQDGKRLRLELKQTVSLVWDLLVVGREQTHWSLPRLFHQGIPASCPIATSCLVYVDTTSNQSREFSLRPSNYETVEFTRGGYTTQLAVYDIKKIKVTNIEAVYSSNHVYGVNYPPPLYAKRFITGYGQEYGGLTTKIYNKHWGTIRIMFLENIPWFVPVYYHTLKVTTNGLPNKPLARRYRVGKERERAYSLELVLDLPPRSVTSVSVEIDKSFLKWQEYPPDANHGFYLGAAQVSALLPIARNYTALPSDTSTIHSLLETNTSLSRLDGYPIRVTTEILILSLPTPDFSMPYNVICLACTVVALAFGPLHNITTKKFVLVEKEKDKKNISRVVIDKVKEAMRKLLRRQAKEKAKEECVTVPEVSDKPNNESKKDR